MNRNMKSISENRYLSFHNYNNISMLVLTMRYFFETYFMTTE